MVRRCMWLACQLGAWYLFISSVWRELGLFNWLGIDYGLFWAATRAFLFDSPVSAYDLGIVAKYLQPLLDFYGPNSPPLQIGPTPYPPIFLMLFVPFAVLPPVGGFVLWTSANVALAAYVLRGLAARYRSEIPGWLMVPLALTFFPLAYTFITGQVTVLLLFALYQAYGSFEEGRDLRAGLWVSVFLLKPQYAVFLCLVLLLKRRWSAVVGIAAGATVLLVSTLAALGPSGVVTYVKSLSYAAGFRPVDPIVHPEQMISWRGILLNIFS